MRVSTRGGRIVLRLRTDDVQLLRALFDQLDDLLAAPPDPDDAVLRRLFPDGYRGDDGAAAEFRSLTEDTLRGERTDRVQSCRADLATSGDVDLTDPDVARRWIQVLNDLRLALGTRIGVTADYAHDLGGEQPDVAAHAVYGWLTYAQDTVLDALMT